MLETKDIKAQEMEQAFYATPFKFSYSSLNKLMMAPNVFYREYIMKDREDSTAKYLLEGTLIHFLILENTALDEKFLVLAAKLPGDTNQAVVREVYKAFLAQNNPNATLVDFRTEILQALITIDKHQSLKDTDSGKGDDKRMAKIVDTQTEEYFTFLKQQEGKTIIDSAMLDRCTLRANIVKSNPVIADLLGLNETASSSFGIYNELPLECPAVGNMPFGYKGIVDNFTIDANKKLIRINDFKTSGKSLTNFKDSVEFWNYWLQAAMYKKLVKAFCQKFIDDSWTIEFRFIVFDKYDQLYAFPVKPETMLEWEENLAKVEHEALYHYENKDYNLPYEYALGNVTL